jgi:flagellar biosynthesis/type III secretory pathway protein FliH
VVRVLDAHARHAYLNAAELMAYANEVSCGIVDQTQADHDEQMRLGYEAGLLAGRAAALEESLKARAERDAALLSLGPRLATLVTRVVTALLGETPEVERVASLVTQALRQLRAVSGRVGIRVHPRHCAHVEQELARWQASYPDAAFAVIGDAQMSTDGCRVEAAGGAIEGAFEAQLAALETALGISPETGPEIALDLAPNFASDHAPDLAPEIGSGLSPDIVPGGVPENLHGGTPDVPRNRGSHV